MKIKKAVITAAGYGTRFFPITKSIQKEMLPILDTPIVDYIVNDCIRAGIEEIIFVVKESDSQIESYYSENKTLYEYLEKMGKLEKYEKLKDLHTKAKFTFIKQSPDEPYGTATPLKIARQHLEGEEGFLVLMGDDFMLNDDGSSDIAKMIEQFNSTQALGLITCVAVDPERIEKYGVAKYEAGTNKLITLVEKPKPEEAPSNLANISKYVLTPEVFSILENQQVDPRLGELLITDTVSELLKKGTVLVHEAKGMYIDCGDIESWLKANITFAEKRGLNL